MEDASRKAQIPRVIKLDRAYKLAEQWVNNMSKWEEDKSKVVKLEPRPPRLGVGATVPRESKVVHSNDPVERKLRVKLETEKKNAAKKAEESGLPARDGISYQDSDDDDEPESKSQAFSKKRPPDFALSLMMNKRNK